MRTYQPKPNHPEIRTGEVFYMNAGDVIFNQIRFNTKRKGIAAYENSEECTPTTLLEKQSNYFPIFIHERELAF